MKKILLSWYGMTDLRAAQGQEQTRGPVLGALLAEEYHEAFILGFTRLQSAPTTESNTAEALPAANTLAAHQQFQHWLASQLQAAGKQTTVRFESVVLQHLNDTQGIYDAATQALASVAASEGEKRVTLYLSPGTPVMAFVWAFAALRRPDLQKRLIASSQPGLPPEPVVLPAEWLEWHGKQIQPAGNVAQHYDVIFHLFGEQRMPALLGVLQFSCAKHIFVNSAQFPADIMKQFIGEAEYAEIAVDPYDPENVRATLLAQIKAMPANLKIGFNLTGGTKLMFAGALAACRNINATPFYFNSRNHQLIYLNDFKSAETQEMASVETFITLNVNNLFISRAGHWDDVPQRNLAERKNLTSALWQVHGKIARLYRELSAYNDEVKPFIAFHDNLSVKLEVINNAYRATISIGQRYFTFDDWPDFARYLTGGWFEEYVFMRLQPLMEAGLIKDMRIGLEVSYKASMQDSGTSGPLGKTDGDAYQELDITFTDGRHLYVIECKAGSVNSEHIMKLQNIIRYLGGGEGRAVLASCFTPRHKVIFKKIDDAKNLHLVSGWNLFEQLEKLIVVGGRRD